jgi:prepilin-type N-terminal cleavage/methylation domain-containing protein
MNHPQSSQGFSLPELLIASTLFVLIAGVVVQSTGSSLRRAEVNAIAVELAGWLETVQRETMSRDRNPNNPDEDQPCAIRFTTGEALATGNRLASAPGGCAPGSQRVGGEDVFLLPGSRAAGRFRVRVLGADNPDDPGFTYTPRGTTTLTEPLTLVFNRDGGGPVRCLRIEPLLGTVSIGAANNPAGLDSTCKDEEDYGGTI